ncbi:MAG TPA: GNAT family N-acetyltransferase [Polyangia bacterium]|jgi:acyl-CoA hydrolase/GNAT superfamily N-acetyltransferase|nr:GNAT family N-acetyltransferase [Polyangia bacterium]
MAQHDDWKTRYADKVATAEAAVKLIRPGRRILIGSGAAEPVGLVEALVQHGDHLADNEIVHLLTLGPAPYVRPEFQARFRHVAFFIGDNVRSAIAEGRADYLPVFLSEIPELLRSRRVRIDVALIQVSPPDHHGYVSLGVSVDIVRAAVDTADLVLAEVNPSMPRTPGDSFVHMSRIERLIPTDLPLIERTPEALDEISLAIGRHVASLIPDGATLQTGIGKIPDAVLASLNDRNDLGVHTEMLSDGVMALAQAGVITGRKKTFLPHKMVTSFIMGSRALYEWAHEHPALEMQPSEFTNDPQVIARHDHMMAINSALAVDLTGQVAADTVAGRFYSGIGGQVDFIRGAARSRGGKAIIALRSTANVKGKGPVSRICPIFEAGAAVVTSRGDVRFVVTEYGVADLWGKNIRERALALIAIAHPDHRAELLAAAKGRRYILPDQVLPRANYPWQEARVLRLPRGETELLLRPVSINDEKPLQDLFYRLSDDSVYRRFMGYKRAYPHEEMQELVDLDYEHNMGLVACAPETGELIGMARYDLDPATRLGDIAFVVRDDWQGRGVGTLLMRRMIEIARARGLAGFQADVLATNQAMLALFQKSGLQFQGALADGIYHLEARLAEAGPVVPPAAAVS